MKGMGLKGGPSPIKLAVAGMGIQIAGGLLQSWMHDKILESVKNMPKPTITAARIWTDPASRERYVPVEILAANLPQVQEDLELSLGRSTVQLISFWRELETAPQEQRLAMLDELEGVVYRDQADVLRAQSNVWRALELEPQILESVEAARDVQEIVSNPVLMGLGRELRRLQPRRAVEDLGQSELVPGQLHAWGAQASSRDLGSAGPGRGQQRGGAGPNQRGPRPRHPARRAATLTALSAGAASAPVAICTRRAFLSDDGLVR
jgi:hypothetical protein